MEINNKVTRHKYGHRKSNEFNSVSDSMAKREFYNNRMKKEQETLLESHTIKEAEMKKQSALLENINNKKINTVKMTRVADKLYESVMTKLVTVAFTEAFNESLYLDTNYKIDNSERLESMVETFVNENGGYKLLESAVKQNKDSIFLKSVYEACKSKAEKITREKCKEADNKPEKIDFDVRLDDIDEFKEDLSKTNIDALGKVVKDKVLNTVIEEKERSIKKQAFEEDIKNEVEGAVTESMKYKIQNRNVIEQPSLFSAMMRKNYSDMLQESVALRTYDSDNKISEIGLDDTDVDYDDKNEHSLTNIGKEEKIETKSMKPEDGEDNYRSIECDSTFDKSALASLDEDSDDIDMFSLTNENVSDIRESDECCDDGNDVDLWCKFVNRSERSVDVKDEFFDMNEDEDDIDVENLEIDELMESFDIGYEPLTEADTNKPGFIAKAKAILKKIAQFFRDLKDRILSIFKKKTTEMSKKIDDDIKKSEKPDNKKDENGNKDTQQNQPPENSPKEGSQVTKKEVSKTIDYFSVPFDVDLFLNSSVDSYRSILKNIEDENEKLFKFANSVFDIIEYGESSEIDSYRERIKKVYNRRISGYKLYDMIQPKIEDNGYTFSEKDKPKLLEEFKRIINLINQSNNNNKNRLAKIEKDINYFNDRVIDKAGPEVTTCFMDIQSKLKEIYQKVTSDLFKLLEILNKQLNVFNSANKTTNMESFTSILDEDDESVFESVLDEYESVLDSEDDIYDNMPVIEATIESFEFDENDELYESLVIDDAFIKSSVEKMSDKDLQKHLPRLQQMIIDLTKELKIAKSGKIPALSNNDIGPIRKFIIKMNVKLTKLTPEKAASNIQELITIGKKEISFTKAELNKRGLKPIKESFTSVLDEDDELMFESYMDEIMLEGFNIGEKFKKIWEAFRNFVTKWWNKIKDMIKRSNAIIMHGSDLVYYDDPENVIEYVKMSLEYFIVNGNNLDIRGNVDIGSIGVECEFIQTKSRLKDAIKKLEKHASDLNKLINSYTGSEFANFYNKTAENNNSDVKIEEIFTTNVNNAKKVLNRIESEIKNLITRKYKNVDSIQESFDYTTLDIESPEYIAIESISKLGNDNKLRIDQRRRVVRLCESLSVAEIADLTAKYRNEATYLNEHLLKLSNMNDMDKAVYVYEASLRKMGRKSIGSDLDIVCEGETIESLASFFDKWLYDFKVTIKKHKQLLLNGNKMIEYKNFERVVNVIKLEQSNIGLHDELNKKYPNKKMLHLTEDISTGTVKEAIRSLENCANELRKVVNTVRLSEYDTIEQQKVSKQIGVIYEILYNIKSELTNIITQTCNDESVIESYNFNEELSSLKDEIRICNEQVGLFNIAAKILVTLESLGLTETCKKGAKITVCSECGADLILDDKCQDCGHDIIKHPKNEVVTESESVKEESAEVFMDKVLCESLIQYTLLEMMHTAKVINYTSNDVRKIALDMIK